MFDQFIRKTVQRKLDGILASRPPVAPGSADGAQAELRLPPAKGRKGVTLAERLVEAMTEEEKLAFVSGVDNFCVRGVPRLGLPRVWTSDATSGIRGLDVTVTDLPANIAMTATWNTGLIRRAAAMVGEECRATGIGVLLAPGVNIARVPVCGRNFEYMGEDPYLAGEMAAAYVQGVQGEGVITTVKHFACNNSDYDRHKTDSVVDERTLHEIYLPAFKRAVEAGSLGLMTSYNQINGEYGSENEYLVEEILRKEWGFDGLVISDWDSLYSTEGPAKHGVDLEMPWGKWMGPEKLGAAIAAGKITMEDIDRKVLHILTSFERAGLFDRPLVDSKATVATADHRNISDAVAEEAIVLLKNESALLPLKDRSIRKLVITGRNAKEVPTGGGGSSFINPTIPVSSLDMELQKRLPGCEIVVLAEDWDKKEDSRRAVAAADLVCIETGYDRVYESEAYDRIWELPPHEADRIRLAQKLNANLVAIVHGGGDMETASWIDAPKAVLHAFYLGTGTAQAIAKVLVGEVNPSGKLPFTMAKSYQDYRSIVNYPKNGGRMSPKRIQGGQGDPDKRRVWPINYAEGLMVGYRNFDTEDLDVRYPFGHGLSYTSFEYADPVVESPGQGELARVSCKITNVGAAAGAEVVQLYVHEQDPEVFRPEQELKGFHKTYLAVGESQRITFGLRKDAFSWYDVDISAWKMKSGMFELRIGSSSRDIRLTVPVEVTEREMGNGE
jgi:beta-glucosidase